MNRHRIPSLFGVAWLASSLLAQASTLPERTDAVVDQVLMPAWVERQGVRQPLSPGLALRNHDRVITGSDARVRIDLADGSVLGLGADTHLELNALGVRERHVFTAALDVPRGALRFSTAAAVRHHQQRAVNLRVGSITAGVRGTDLWGSADSEQDRLCLLEGSITVLHPQAEAQEISEVPSCYRANTGAAPAAVESATAQQVAVWVTQTALQIGSGQASRDGRWVVELATLDSEAAALSLYDQARAAGYAARIKPLAVAGGGYHYSVRIAQLATEIDAATLAARIAQLLPVSTPFVARR
ncbi:Sporulation domain protein [Candidatus Accumulibacter aalborgensis]|uniref:Sporulation domain protein n=1 Tax=Candidatus Accumulibacter aalborgensis TaxID=1860102 RepID=A0A1A8XLP5_9PROT|nr:FecR family protein [Candidatus Accumulibacter aalborgensis]SBT04868.1 Sporulation domain protein [Candidatus Accumulibacter aalborgensis]